MPTHAYTEDQLCEEPAIGLFTELGWQTVSALEETFGTPSPGLAATLSHPMGEGASLGRETKGEVVLVSRLRAALQKVNPALPPEAITAAVSGLAPVSPASEMACFSETPVQATGHRSGHEARQESGLLVSSGLLSSVNTDNAPDIYADI